MSDHSYNGAEQSEHGGPVPPVRLDVEYPERPSRLLLLVKWLLVIPLYFAMGVYGIAAMVVGFIAFWAILFTGRFPEGMFDFIWAFLAFAYKTMAYFPLLLTDQWTPDDTHPLDFQVDRPERLSRPVLLFVKLPSYLLEVAWSLATVGVSILMIAAIPTWFVILISGRYPKALFRFNISVLQWAARVSAWQWLMRDDLSLFGTTRIVQVPVALGAAAFLYIGIGLSPWLPVSLPGASTIDRWVEEPALPVDRGFFSTTPVDVKGLSNGVVAVTAGVNHTCAATTADVKRWGANFPPRHGIETTTYRSTPVDVVGFTSGVVALSAGVSHRCAVTTAGGVKCWGEN